jgi:hypothetical protein
MSVVSVKVPPEVKEDMERVKDRVKWSEEIRKFIIEKLQEEKRRRAVENAERVLSGLRVLPGKSAAELVREDRDSHN